MRKHLDKIIFLTVISIYLYTIFEMRVTERNRQNELISKFESNFEIQEDKNEGDVFSVKKALLETIGVLYVPDIDLKMAVFSNAGEAALNEGAGLIVGTGNLIPYENSNSVITSHNGDSLKDLFINVPKLKAGDHFYIKNRDSKIYKYEVFDTRDVSPINEFEKILQPKADESYVTLRTCTPIGINSHRFLATGKLIEEVETIPNSSFTLSLFEIGLIAIATIALILLLISIIKKDDQKENKENGKK